MIQPALKPFVNQAGRLYRLPIKHSKRLMVLDWVITDFDPGRTYTEKQVNEILKMKLDDFALVRRMLVDNGLLSREKDGSAYQLSKGFSNE